MSGLIHLPAPRQIATATPGVTVPVQAELVNWAGVHLMLHKSHRLPGISPRPDTWTCSHELTGWLIATGPSPETALAAAICRIRANLECFRAQVEALPVINPIVIAK